MRVLLSVHSQEIFSDERTDAMGGQDAEHYL